MDLPVPVQRADFYLSRIAGDYSGELPEPVSRADFYLSKICGDYSGELPEPVSRQDYYLAKIAGIYSGILPVPVARADYYLSAIAGEYDGELPLPVARWDYYLAKIAVQSQFVVRHAQGSSILLHDSVRAPLEGLRIFGRSTQDGVPSPENPVPIVSAGDSGEISLSLHGGNLLPHGLETGNANNSKGLDIIYENGVVDVSGTIGVLNGNRAFIEISINYIEDGTYYISATGGSGTVKAVADYKYKQNGVLCYDTSGVVEVDKDKISKSIRILIDGTSNMEVGTPVNFRCKVMLSKKTGIEFESVILPKSLLYHIPNGLPGIPVSSGGNYTDESGQQWVCDEIDFGRGVYVQRVKEIELNSFLGWDGEEKFAYIILKDSFSIDTGIFRRIEILCNRFLYSTSVENTGIGFIFRDYLRCYLGDIAENLDEANQWLSTHPTNALYMIVPEETPLTPEALAVYASLCTNSPSTTIINSAGAWMDVGYKAKPTSMYRMRKK